MTTRRESHADLRIHRVTDLPAGLDDLLERSCREGFRFLPRLRREWRGGANRYDGPGEALLAARLGRRLVGVCGLCRDPYAADPAVGRLRHLYVAPAHRRGGVGGALVRRTLRLARGHFRVVRLRTDTVAGARFYAGLGFTESRGNATHERLIPAGRPDVSGDPSG